MRDRKILVLYHHGVTRKEIARQMQMQYETVKKSLYKMLMQNRRMWLKLP
jgi:DNA-binding NarL/FixJ family response regulator